MTPISRSVIPPPVAATSTIVQTNASCASIPGRASILSFLESQCELYVPRALLHQRRRAIKFAHRKGRLHTVLGRGRPGRRAAAAVVPVGTAATGGARSTNNRLDRPVT
jgi:hypothetical protein